MKLSGKMIGVVSALFMTTSVAGVDIANFEEVDCDWSEIMIFCLDQPARVCCGFPQRATTTHSVGWRGLSQGDIATWFTGQRLMDGTTNHCAQRRNQVMAGPPPGEVCMSVQAGERHYDNDGANW